MTSVARKVHIPRLDGVVLLLQVVELDSRRIALGDSACDAVVNVAHETSSASSGE